MSEQAESLADEAVRTDLRCEQTPSAQPIFMGLRIVSVKVLNRYEVRSISRKLTHIYALIDYHWSEALCRILDKHAVIVLTSTGSSSESAMKDVEDAIVGE